MKGIASISNMPMANYRIISNNVGNTAILYPFYLGGYGFIVARLQHDGMWQRPTVLAEIEGFVWFFDGIWEDSGEFNLIFNESSILTVRENETSNVIEINSLNTLMSAPRVDIWLTNVFYFVENVRLDGVLPVRVDVLNIGIPIDGISVLANGEQIGIYQGLLTGEPATIEFELDIPTTMSAQTDFVISVEPVGQTDVDMSDNLYVMTLGHVNLALSLDRRNLEDNTVTVFANIINDSDYVASARLYVHRGALDGNVIQSINLGEVAGRVNILEEFNFDPRMLILDGEEFETLFFEIVSDVEELFTADNSGFVVIHALGGNELTGVEPLTAIGNIPNGTAATAAALGLPTQIQLNLEDAPYYMMVAVIWHVEGSDYNPTLTTKQTFNVTGTFSLPLDVANTANHPLIATISVTVLAYDLIAQFAPTITSTNNTSIIHGTGGTFTVTATGTTPFVFSISGEPEGVSIDSATSIMTIASSASMGTHTFTVMVNNVTNQPDSQSFTLTITQQQIVPQNVTITFNPAGGVLRGTTSTTPISIPHNATLRQIGIVSFTHGDLLPFRAYHIFNGWVMPNGRQFTVYTTVTSNIILTAHWTLAWSQETEPGYESDPTPKPTPWHTPRPVVTQPPQTYPNACTHTNPETHTDTDSFR